MTEAEPATAASLEFSFEWTPEDLLAFNRNHSETSPTMQRILTIRRWLSPAVAVGLGLCVSVNMESPIPVAVAVLYGVLWVMLWPKWYRRRLDALLLKMYGEGSQASHLGTHHAAFRDGVITCRYPGGYTETKFTSIIRVAETPDHFFLYTTSTTALILPKRSLPPEIVAFIRQQWPAPASGHPMQA